VIVPRGSGTVANEEFLRSALTQAPQGSSCFGHGVLGNRLSSARQMRELAASRRIPLFTGTSVAVTWRLPEVDLPPGIALKEALIVVQGESPSAELDGLQGLLPVLERRRGGETGVRRVKHLAGEDVWRAGKADEWSWPLLAAALSRSDSPQGDALKDGRTQDLAGLGLVPKLARNPRGWLLEHADGLRTAILILDRVVADINFAAASRDGTQFSAQLYRPPAPAEHSYSRLAAVIEDFFRSGVAPWPATRDILVAGLLETLRQPSARSGRWLATAELVRDRRAGK
jgi:hypothetical protein